MGHEYQNYQIVEMLHPVVRFKAYILIRVSDCVRKYKSKITIEKYYKTIEKVISTITPIICNNYLIRHRNFMNVKSSHIKWLALDKNLYDQ